MTSLKLRDNDEIRSRITQSAEFKPLSPTDITTFIHHQLDRSGLPHNTFSEAALNLINKASHGNLRATKNLCLGSMVEAVRAQTKSVDIEQVTINRTGDRAIHSKGANLSSSPTNNLTTKTKRSAKLTA